MLQNEFIVWLIIDDLKTIFLHLCFLLNHLQQALLVIFAIAFVIAAPAQDESIVNDVAQNEEVMILSPNADPESFLKLLKLKKLLLLG